MSLVNPPLLRENFEISKKDILNPPLEGKFSLNLLSYQEKFSGVFDPRLPLCSGVRVGGGGAPPPGNNCKFRGYFWIFYQKHID